MPYSVLPMGTAELTDVRLRPRRRTRLDPRARLGLLALWLVFLAVLVALVLGAAEVGLRVRREWLGTHAPLPPNDDPRLVPDRLLRYKNRPAYSYQSGLRSGAVLHYTNNALGFRGPELSPTKPPGVYRVAIVGGSTVYGALNDDPDTIALKLQALLQADLGPNIEVINAGVPSYEALREALFTRSDVVALQPDVIVDLDGLNDVFFGTLEEWPSQVAADQIGIVGDGHYPEAAAMVDRTMFPNGLLEHQLWALGRDLRAHAYRLSRQPAPPAPRVVSDRIVALYAGSQGLLARYGREHGAAVITALQPLIATGHKALTPDEQGAVRHEGYWTGGGGGWQQLAPGMYRRMRAAAGPAVAAEGGTFMDLSGAFDAEAGSTYGEDAVHYTPLGNQRLADALLPLVEQRLRAAGAP
jgi:hypothetical protein